MQIQEEDPGVEDVHTLLLEHLADIRTHSPLHSKLMFLIYLRSAKSLMCFTGLMQLCLTDTVSLTPSTKAYA